MADAIAAALPVVREVRGPTPLEVVELEGGGALLIKREDVPPIYAYKWRGASNKIAHLTADERARGIVAASAGNHAQGVALAAARHGISARIFMPLSTPVMKREAVGRLGGDSVEVVLHGDNFDAASELAHRVCAEQGGVFVHPYDDLHVIAGQGTLGAEVAEELGGEGTPDVAFLQIGGGGMAAGVACWLKRVYPNIRIIGVEGTDQASMAAAVAAGGPVDLGYVDVFCDGTAVRRAGDLTYALCRGLVDEFVTVTNEEVCGAERFLWNARRIATEPAGAMGVAAWLKARERWAGRRALVVLCGANMDFAQFGYIARHADLAEASRRFFRFTIRERNGALHALLKPIRDRANIVEFQYGKTDLQVAHPVIGMEASAEVFDDLAGGWRRDGIEFAEVGGRADVEFRIVHYRSELFRRPLFVRVEFPERAGALADFMGRVHPFAGICYFNYLYTGERVGRALLGFEFAHDADREKLVAALSSPGSGLRGARAVPDEVTARILA